MKKYYRMLLQEEQTYSKEFLVPVGDGEGYGEAEDALNNAAMAGAAKPDYSCWDRCEANVVGLEPDGDEAWDDEPEPIESDKTSEELEAEYGAPVLRPGKEGSPDRAALTVPGRGCYRIPCMAGDTLYEPSVPGKGITEHKVLYVTLSGGPDAPRITIHGERTSGVGVDPLIIHPEDVGKKFFLTRGEAQAALDELLEKEGA